MRARLLVLFLLPLATYSARAQGAATDSAAVLTAVQAFDAAWAAKDTVAAGQSLASDFRYFTSTGGVRSRAQLLEFLASPAYRVERAQRSALEPRITGTTAVVSSRWQGNGAYAGGTFNDDQRCSLVLLKQGHAWRILAEHCTPILPES